MARGRDDNDRKAISPALVKWFRKRQRNLPWRNTYDPYRIWISEVMLQQTTVAAVGPYYERFLERFPDVQSLAAASEQDVLAAWAGLGYYRRARMLREAAGKIVLEHGGRFPESVEELQALPGFGRYTASAVAGFAFGVRAPIVEANSARVLARLFGVREAISQSATMRRLWTHAEEILPQPRHVREHNYAIMELGSLVCRPRTPQCPECPVASACDAFRLGLTDVIPPAEEKQAKIEKAFVGLILQRGHKYLVRQIPQGEWHASMFEFPKVEVSPGSSLVHENAAADEFARTLGSQGGVEHFADLKYTVTRHSVRLSVYRSSVRRLGRGTSKIPLPPASYYWKTLEEIAQLPLGSAQRKLLLKLESEK